MEKFNKGDQAEAVDELGVWAKCRVLESQHDFAVVTFPPWPQKWNKKITASTEIRRISEDVLIPRNLRHSKVRK